MNRKRDLLAILAGTVCPICHRAKPPQAWTCRDCGDPHRGSPEHAVLAWACQGHMVAAERYLAKVGEQDT